MTFGPADPQLKKRRFRAALFKWICISLTGLTIVALIMLLSHVTRQGFSYVDWQFLSSFPSRKPDQAGIRVALFGTLWIISLTALFAIPVGVAAAIYLEEYARPNRLNRFLEINLTNLAGVPSIVYGILGLAVFVRWVGLGTSVLAGALTMGLLVLPVIILASREAIRAVPKSIRLAAFAIGATRWETIRHHVLPSALPGILTGIILAISRAIGETAPLILVGAAAAIFNSPRGPMDNYSALPIQIYSWASRPKPEFQQVAAAGIIVLLIVLLMMNATAVYIRNRSRKGL